MMKRQLVAICFVLAWTLSLQAQTPTITGLRGEGVDAFCPGGVGFVQGTNLGTSTSIAVTVGTKKAAVLNAFSTSLQIQFPVDAPLGPTTITAGASAPFNVTLGQYCPGIPIDNGVTGAFHVPSGARVTAAFPAIPNEQISLGASGLGPTNPVYATGTAPKDGDFSAAAVTKPTITIGGVNATVSDAFLSPNSPGFYNVVFTVPATVTSGNRPLALSIGGLTSTASLPITTGPIVSSVSNAATYIDIGPRYGIAPGAIFVLKGVNLGPANLSIDPKPFQNTTLSGTSVAVTVSGATVQALMYYTSSGQIAALLPSNTPTGVGTVTVTYNGQASPAANFRVPPNNLGIFTINADGAGIGIVTYPDYSLVSTTKAANCGGVNTTCGAANPGDVLTVWATGLGAVNGSDAAGAGLGVNIPSIPLTIWLGDVQVSAVYQGRSGCCAGEDQIIFTVPANAPLGCAVPLMVQINNNLSNSVALAVAAAGSRSCSPVDPSLPAALVTALAANPGPFTYGEINIMRLDNYGQGGSGFTDQFDGGFLRITVPSATQPFFFSYIDQPPVGTCQTFNTPNGQPDPPIDAAVGIEGGQVTLQGPNGSKTTPSSGGDFSAELSASGNFLSPGQYTVNVSAGKDVGASIASITIPLMPTMTSPPPDAAAPFVVTRANGLAVTWSGGSPTGLIQIKGSSATDNTFSAGASFQCLVSAAGGAFTIPPSVMLALPPNNFGGLQFQPLVTSSNWTGSGLAVTRISARYDYFAPLSFR
jgi:uncharacterized protein (TIGR03437 family)